jgi:hypothetical protein
MDPSMTATHSDAPSLAQLLTLLAPLTSGTPPCMYANVKLQPPIIRASLSQSLVKPSNAYALTQNACLPYDNDKLCDHASLRFTAQLIHGHDNSILETTLAALRVYKFGRICQNSADSVEADFPKFGIIYLKCRTVHPKFGIKIKFGHVR